MDGYNRTQTDNLLLDRMNAEISRWILMCHDRVRGDHIALTHGFLAIILAVRRASVTTALHVLERQGLIQSEWNLVVVRNRPGLEAFAGSAYGRSEAEYRNLIGPL